jgi:polar amino acid transport system substrate-binding protein
MLEQVRAELAPTDVLRAAINLSNFLLVSDRTPSGDPIGVSPDMAAAVAERLGVPVAYILYDTPAQRSDSLNQQVSGISSRSFKGLEEAPGTSRLVREEVKHTI